MSYLTRDDADVESDDEKDGVSVLVHGKIQSTRPLDLRFKQSVVGKSSILHHACQYEPLETVRALVNTRECSPNIRNVDRNTPLHIACSQGRLDVVKFLLQQCNCDSEIPGYNNRTPLHFACQRGCIDVVKLLVETVHCRTTVTDKDGCIPLHLASEYGHLCVTRYLIVECNCDPNAANNAGRTPLHLACLQGHENIIKYLVSKQTCDPASSDHSGYNCLHLACSGGHLDIVKYLIGHGLDLQTWTMDGNTPLQLAQNQNSTNLVHYIKTVVSASSLEVSNPGPLTGLIDRPGRQQRDFSQRKERLKTYRESPHPWPRSVNPEQLADVGFIYTGQDDVVECFQCKIRVGDWKETDEPLSRHYLRNPNCPFLIDNYGEALKRFDQTRASKYANPSYRLHSFLSWPLGHIVTSYQLANVGFYYSGHRTKVQCFSCGLIYEEWKRGDVPLLIHRKLSPLCQFLNQLISKGSPAPTPIESPTQPQGLPLSPYIVTQPSSSMGTSRSQSQKDLSRPDWANELKRLMSFKYLPHDFPCSKEDCAQAGLYFVRRPDIMKCFSCDVVVKDWVDGDIPVEKHREVSPNCKFLEEIFPSKLEKMEGIDPSSLPEPKYTQEELIKLSIAQRPSLEPATREYKQLEPALGSLSLSSAQYQSSFPTSHATLPASEYNQSLYQQLGIQPYTRLRPHLDPLGSAHSNQTASSAPSVRQSFPTPYGSVSSYSFSRSQSAKEGFAQRPRPREEYVFTSDPSSLSTAYKQIHSSAQVMPQAHSSTVAEIMDRPTHSSTVARIMDRPVVLPPSYYQGAYLMPQGIEHYAPLSPQPQSQPSSLSDDNKVCVVCMDAPLEVVLIPCGHVCVCEACSSQITLCPMCRRRKDSAMKVFLPY